MSTLFQLTTYRNHERKITNLSETFNCKNSNLFWSELIFSKAQNILNCCMCPLLINEVIKASDQTTVLLSYDVEVYNFSGVAFWSVERKSTAAKKKKKEKLDKQKPENMTCWWNHLHTIQLTRSGESTGKEISIWL